MNSKTAQSIRAIAGLLFGLAAFTLPGQAAQPAKPSFAPTLLDIEQLPRLRPIVKVGSFSSYDPKGGADDGHGNSGKFSFLRKEGNGVVIAEVSGPGAITRLYTPTPIEAPIEFYFDGETKPRLMLPFTQV